MVNSFKERFFSNKKLIFDIFLILFLGLLSITWFRGNNLISGGDFGLPLDRFKYFSLMFSTWDETISMGFADYRQITSLIPYALWGVITQFLHLSIFFWEKSLFYFWFAGAGLSMYFLCSVLRMKRLGKLASSIFYMFNPFSLIVIWHIPHGFIQASYAFAPLLLAFYIYGLNKEKGIKYIIFTCFIALLIISSAYVNPRAVIVHWLPIFLYFLIAFFLQKKKRVFILKYTLKFFTVWLFFNLFWLFPFVFSISESIKSAHSAVIMNDIETLKLNSVKFFEAIRMMGLWSLNSGYKGEPYYSYEAHYRLLPIILTSWLIPVLVFLGFFHKEAKRKLMFFFLIFMIFFGLIGMSGAHLPFSGILLWPYKVFQPLTLLARFTFLFFGIPTYLVFTVLLGYGVILIQEWTKRKIGKIIFLPLTILFILLFVVLVWPFWNGEVIRSEGKNWPGERIKVPSYWWEAKKWLENQKDFFRILPLPMSKTYNVAFDWEGGYSGGDPTRWLTSQPVLNANTGETFRIPELIGGLIEKKAEFKDLSKLLGFLNVKYLLVREDIRWDFLRGHGWWFKQTPENIDFFLSQQKDLNLVKEIGKFKFYEIPKDYLLPHIYIPQKLSLVNGEAEAFVDIVPFLEIDKKEAIIISEQNEDKNFIPNDEFNQFFAWQKPKILFSQPIQSLRLSEAIDPLPHARILPNSRIYFLIQAKEYLAKLFSPSSKKLELGITFTGKRLREVYGLLEKENISLTSENDALKEININLVIKTINRSFSEWQTLNRQIEKIKNQDLKEEIDKKIGSQVIVQLNFLKSLEKSLESEQYLNIQSALLSLEKILEEKREKYIEINELNSGDGMNFENEKIVYNIEVPQDGDYELHLRDDDISKYYDLSKKIIPLSIDNDGLQERTIEFTQINSVFLGNFYFKKGSHTINISIPPSLNLISDPSFEQGVWSGAVSIPAHLKSEISATQSADFFHGKFSLEVSTTQNNAAVLASINNFKYGDFYKISFAAKQIEGRQPVFGVWENDTESNIPDFNFQKMTDWGTADPLTLFYFLKDLPSDKNWHQYAFILKPQDATQFLGLAFLSLQPKIGRTVNLYDDVKVERIFTNPIFLKSPSLEKNRSFPDIQFTKIRPTKYQVDVKNATEPYFLVFSESFHPGWKASIEGEHLMINGFANAWHLKKTGDYQIILNFEPQKVYYISISISVSAFLAAMVFLLIKKKKNEN